MLRLAPFRFLPLSSLLLACNANAGPIFSAKTAPLIRRIISL
jgi:hypothetical protein